LGVGSRKIIVGCYKPNKSKSNVIFIFAVMLTVVVAFQFFHSASHFLHFFKIFSLKFIHAADKATVQFKTQPIPKKLPGLNTLC